MIDVLVIDDDFMVARIHAGFVSQEDGFKVAGVSHTAAEGLAAVAALRPQLVLLDIHLPDGHGLDLLAQMREVAPELDALVITAAREQATVGRALRGGAVSYLMKPFQREDLSGRLQQYRQRVSAVAGDGAADQVVVDRLFGGMPAAAPTPRKGLSAHTLQAVRDALRAARADLSATQTAELIGVSRVSARRYLEHLTEEGVVTVELRYGAGRPERRYRLAG